MSLYIHKFWIPCSCVAFQYVTLSAWYMPVIPLCIQHHMDIYCDTINFQDSSSSGSGQKMSSSVVVPCTLEVLSTDSQVFTLYLFLAIYFVFATTFVCYTVPLLSLRMKEVNKKTIFQNSKTLIYHVQSIVLNPLNWNDV